MILSLRAVQTVMSGWKVTTCIHHKRETLMGVKGRVLHRSNESKENCSLVCNCLWEVAIITPGEFNTAASGEDLPLPLHLSCVLQSCNPELQALFPHRASKSTPPYYFFHLRGFKRPECIKGFYFTAHLKLLRRGSDISSLIKIWP